MSGAGSSSRDRILSRIRDALARREVVDHPGAFLGWRPVPGDRGTRHQTPGDHATRDAAPENRATDHPTTEAGARATDLGVPGDRHDDASRTNPVDGFVELFRAAGGETVQVRDRAGAAAWLQAFAEGFPTITFGSGVPQTMRPGLTEADPRDASLGVSMARGAVGETGSLILDARDGRRAQLLVPAHVVIVEATTVHATLVDALMALKSDLPSAIGLHSGPSKSADIGQIMVKGVHGPGRVIALIVNGGVDG